MANPHFVIAVLEDGTLTLVNPADVANKAIRVNVVANSAGGGAVTIADGADIAEGATADVAITSDSAGTISAKLRGLVKWAFERMPASLGQKAMAASFPVVLSSDQSAVPVSGTVATKTDLAPSSPALASVGVASAPAVAANAIRKGLSATNTSNNRVSLGFGATAVLDSGVTLYPGDSFIMDEYSFDTGVVNAIASSAGSNLAIQEYV